MWAWWRKGIGSSLGCDGVDRELGVVVDRELGVEFDGVNGVEDHVFAASMGIPSRRWLEDVSLVDVIIFLPEN